MQISLKNCTIRALGLLLLFGLYLITVSGILNAKQFDPQNRSLASSLAKQKPRSSAEWKEIQIKDKVVIRIPQTMKMVEPLGDALWYREAYSNKNIGLAISYGDVLIPDAKLPDSLTLCDTAALQRDEPTLTVSAATIDGRQAKLQLRRGRGFVFAAVCFAKAPDNPIPLFVGAYCKNEQAVDIAQEIFKSIKFKG